jgi:hypothetical protein
MQWTTSSKATIAVLVIATTVAIVVSTLYAQRKISQIISRGIEEATTAHPQSSLASSSFLSQPGPDISHMIRGMEPDDARRAEPRPPAADPRPEGVGRRWRPLSEIM